MKDLSHYTFKEFEEICQRLPYDLVEIVYGYYHRDKTYTVEGYAMRKGISVATLYRYIRRVIREFERH